MIPGVMETRSVLAIHEGYWLRCRGIAMRDNPRTASSFVSRIEALINGGWVWVSSHAWIDGGCLCRHYGRGVLLEFDAQVRSYTSADPTTGENVRRYGLTRPTNVAPLGPAPLLEMVRELVAVWGWDRVADAVEQAHTGG
jgi:hypothetical protein